MSQNTCKANGLTFMFGWDRPLEYFFLVIFAEDGDVVWTNLSRQFPGMSLDEIDETMQKYGHRLSESDRQTLIGDRLRESGI